MSEDRSFLDEAEAELAGVDAALERLDAGTYGRCVVCGEALPDGALAGDPLIQRCAEHS